jgi:hypothetical protein
LVQAPLTVGAHPPVAALQQATCGQGLGEQTEPGTPIEPPLVHAPFTERAHAPTAVQQATCGQGFGEQVKLPASGEPAPQTPPTARVQAPTGVQQETCGQALGVQV